MTFGKRCFDVVGATIGFVVTSPIMLFAACAILIFDGRPVLFKQQRIGRDSKLFTLYKFRSMREASAGPLVTGADDPRITSLGHILRKTKIDELPQFFNILAGHMSFVGPRPDVERYLDHVPSDLRDVLKLTPGLTSPATIAFRNEEQLFVGIENREQYYVQHIMPQKMKMNLEYAQRATLWSDLVVILQTVCAIILPSTSNGKMKVNLP